jgi:hypothetical protein
MSVEQPRRDLAEDDLVAEGLPDEPEDAEDDKDDGEPDGRAA